MPKQRESRVYWREQGEDRRAYGDFRDYADVGGKREALIPQGGNRATTDPDVADQLAAERVKELEKRRRSKVMTGVERQAGLKSFAAYHLKKKKKSGQVTDRWLEDVERHLDDAVAFFGAGTELNAIGVSDVQRYVDDLQGRPNGQGGTLSGSSVRKYLNSLSNLYRRAAGEGYVPPGYNPVSALMDKPKAESKEARWLEVHDAALYLKAARGYRAAKARDVIPFAHELIATYLLTGARKSEVLGLTVDDVSFDRQRIRIRPHPHRRVKTASARRSVPLWPQLEETLRGYVFGGDGPVSGLLFPSPRGGGMLSDLRKLLDGVAERAGFEEGEIRCHLFRHTYCAARLQTLDQGAPVSPFTVAREMGHGGTALVERIYGHLGEIRHRSEVVEFRADQHAEELGPRLRALQATG